MKNYLLILKLLIKDLFKKRDKKQSWIFILLGALYFVLGVFIVIAIIYLSPFFLDAGKQAEFIGWILFLDFIMTVILGLITSISYLFMSKDTEFFKALPVKPSSVFMAKLSLVFLSEAVVSAAILLPALLTAGMCLQLTWLFYVLIPLFVLCVPVLSLLVISLLSFPLVYIMSVFKNRSMVASIAVILIFGAAFSLYMVFMTSMQNIDDQSAQGFLGAADGLSYAVYPLYMLAMFACFKPVFGLGLPASMALSFGIFALSIAALVFLSYFLSVLGYNRITGRLLENNAGRAKKGKFVASSGIGTLMKNEWRGIIRSPMVAMQVVSGVLLCPIITVLFSVIFGNTAGLVASDPDIGLTVDLSPIIWLSCIMSLLMFGVGMNQGAATSISREGKGIAFLKGLPLAAADIIKAKRNVYLLVQGASIVTGLVAMTVTMIVYESFIWWIPLGCGAVAVSWLFAMVNLSVFWDLKNPKLNWKSQREVLKRGKNNLLSLIWIFSVMILCVVLFIFVIGGVVANAAGIILTGFIILTAAGTGAAFGFWYLLKSTAERLFAEIKG